MFVGFLYLCVSMPRCCCFSCLKIVSTFCLIVSYCFTFFFSFPYSWYSLSLPQDRLEIVLLYYFLGMSDTEIAAHLNLVRRTVAYRRTSSLQELKKFMEINADEWNDCQHAAHTGRQGLTPFCNMEQHFVVVLPCAGWVDSHPDMSEPLIFMEHCLDPPGIFKAAKVIVLGPAGIR